MSNVVIGYSFAYIYLTMVMGIAYVSFRILKNNEISRKIIHIATGSGWIILKVFLGPSIHTFLITMSFVILTVATNFLKIDFVERKNSSLGTVFYTATMASGALLTYFYSDFMDSWGIGMLCLAFGDGFAGIIGTQLNKKKSGKSLVGSLSCFLTSLIIVCVIVRCFEIHLDVFHCIILCIIATVIEAFTEEYDNIYIPVIVMLYSYAFIYNANSLALIYGIIIGSVICSVCIIFKVLSRNASILLLFLISLVYIYAGRKAILSLVMIYSTIIVADKIASIKKRNKDSDKSARSLRQLCPNCVPAAIMIVLWGISNNELFLITFFAAISEAIADSMASDIGIFSRTDPIDILTFKKVTPGLSGGVTVLGTSLSFLVCIYAALVYKIMYQPSGLKSLSIIVLASFIGVVIDSIVGSRFQVKYECSQCRCITEKKTHCNLATTVHSGVAWLDNIRVNWFSNIASIAVGTIIYFILGGG